MQTADIIFGLTLLIISYKKARLPLSKHYNAGYLKQVVPDCHHAATLHRLRPCRGPPPNQAILHSDQAHPKLAGQLVWCLPTGSSYCWNCISLLESPNRDYSQRTVGGLQLHRYWQSLCHYHRLWNLGSVTILVRPVECFLYDESGRVSSFTALYSSLDI